MKKILALVFAAILCVSVLAACTPTEEEASDANLMERGEKASDADLEESDDSEKEVSDNQEQ